jgi:hypothetical protein
LAVVVAAIVGYVTGIIAREGPCEIVSTYLGAVEIVVLIDEGVLGDIEGGTPGVVISDDKPL